MPYATLPLEHEQVYYEMQVSGFESSDDELMSIETMNNTADLHDWRPLGGHHSLAAYWGCACAVHYGSDHDDAEWELPGANANANRSDSD